MRIFGFYVLAEYHMPSGVILTLFLLVAGFGDKRFPGWTFEGRNLHFARKIIQFENVCDRYIPDSILTQSLIRTSGHQGKRPASLVSGINICKTF